MLFVKYKSSRREVYIYERRFETPIKRVNSNRKIPCMLCPFNGGMSSKEKKVFLPFRIGKYVSIIFHVVSCLRGVVVRAVYFFYL